MRVILVAVLAAFFTGCRRTERIRVPGPKEPPMASVPATRTAPRPPARKARSHRARVTLASARLKWVFLVRSPQELLDRVFRPLDELGKQPRFGRLLKGYRKFKNLLMVSRLARNPALLAGMAGQGRLTAPILSQLRRIRLIGFAEVAVHGTIHTSDSRASRPRSFSLPSARISFLNFAASPPNLMKNLEKSGGCSPMAGQPDVVVCPSPSGKPWYLALAGRSLLVANDSKVLAVFPKLSALATRESGDMFYGLPRETCEELFGDIQRSCSEPWHFAASVRLHPDGRIEAAGTVLSQDPPAAFQQALAQARPPARPNAPSPWLSLKVSALPGWQGRSPKLTPDRVRPTAVWAWHMRGGGLGLLAAQVKGEPQDVASRVSRKIETEVSSLVGAGCRKRSRFLVRSRRMAGLKVATVALGPALRRIRRCAGLSPFNRVLLQVLGKLFPGHLVTWKTAGFQWICVGRLRTCGSHVRWSRRGRSLSGPGPSNHILQGVFAPAPLLGMLRKSLVASTKGPSGTAQALLALVKYVRPRLHPTRVQLIFRPKGNGSQIEGHLESDLLTAWLVLLFPILS